LRPAVLQVLAATLPIAALRNQVGTVIKFVRVLMLAPVVPFLIVRRSRSATHSCPTSRRSRFHELLPWFIVGFLVVLVGRRIDSTKLAGHDHQRLGFVDDGCDGGAWTGC
jgi:uncharacterized membrane protein YadS